MLRTEQNNYRRAFWIAVSTTIALAIVASALWWRLSHSGAASQPGKSSASEPMEAMAQTSNASELEPGTEGKMQMSNMQEAPRAPIQLTPQRMQSIGIVLGKVESKPVNSELRLEVFNVLNTAQFNNPNGQLGNSAFGTISSIVASPSCATCGTTERQIQLAAKLKF